MKEVGVTVGHEGAEGAFPPMGERPEVRGDPTRAERLIRAAVLVMGILAQMAGTAGGLYGAFDHPVVGLVIAAIGCAMATSVLLQLVAAKRQPVVLVILAKGEPVRLTPRYRPGPRALAAMGLVVVVGAFGWFARQTMTEIRAPDRVRLLDYDSYPHRYLNNALVESTFNGRLSRFTTFTGRILDERRLDYGLRFTTAASLSARGKFYGPTTLDHETFAIEFELQARPAFAPVKVEAIRVIVDGYEPLPSYETPVSEGPVYSDAPFRLYHAVLVKPSPGANRKVLARLVATDDSASAEAGVFLTADKPTPFLVKIEAPEPGFYGFDVEVLLSSGFELQRFGIRLFNHVLFY
ncbi:MAG TPA: hypothetical protein VJ997_15785 [Longimicrobiales bacterium]|nr:hypothetical protein [Longimicrobiales bacterium]